MFYNFIVKKRFKVAKDIVDKYLIPLPQVIALFCNIYHRSYFERLNEHFGDEIKEINMLS